MIDLSYSFVKGVSENELSKEGLLLANELLRLKALKKTKKGFILAQRYRIGKLDISSNGTGYLSPFSHENKKDLLIGNNSDLKNASKDDIVVAKIFFSKSSRPRAKIIFVLYHANSHTLVYTKNIHGKIVGINIKTSINVSLTSSQKSLKSLPEKTVLKIDNQNGIIEEVLGVLEDDSIDEKISLNLFGKVEEFSTEANTQALSYGDKIDKSLHQDLEDLTHLPFCTIDPIDAKDFDDAIFYDHKKSILYVAIADVSSYVYPYSAIDKEAKQRAFSIYLPHKSIPMLPRNLSENICSLKPNEDRLTFCFKLYLNEQNCVIKEELSQCLINSKRRFNYEEIDVFLKREYKNPNRIDELIFAWLEKLAPIVKKIRKKRLENAFEFISDEFRMEVDDNQRLLRVVVEKETPSHALIEDCMLLANKAAANKLGYGVFRNHQSPSFERIEELLADLKNIGLDFELSAHLPSLIRKIQAKADELDLRAEVDKLIIKSQKKALYESENKGHFGLGFSTYTHFTSPIRRYSDLLVHRLLKAKLQKDEKQTRFLLAKIDMLCEDLSTKERQSDMVARDYMDRKFARWAKENIGKIYKAIITDIGKNVIAKLDDDIIKGVRVFLSDTNVGLLQKVYIKILEADIASTIIIAKIA